MQEADKNREEKERIPNIVGREEADRKRIKFEWEENEQVDEINEESLENKDKDLEIEFFPRDILKEEWDSSSKADKSHFHPLW